MFLSQIIIDREPSGFNTLRTDERYAVRDDFPTLLPGEYSKVWSKASLLVLWAAFSRSIQLPGILFKLYHATARYG